MQEIDVEMEDVVAVGVAQHPIEHGEQAGGMIVDPGEPAAPVGAPATSRAEVTESPLA